MSRLYAPNTNESFVNLKPELDLLGGELFPAGSEAIYESADEGALPLTILLKSAEDPGRTQLRSALN